MSIIRTCGSLAAAAVLTFCLTGAGSPPTYPPTPPTPTETTPPPTPEPSTETPPPPSPGPDNHKGNLPFTGAPLAVLTALGLGLIAGSAIVLTVVRRRSPGA